MHHYRNCRLHH